MFENVPKNWKKQKLKNFIDIIRGVNYKSSEAYETKSNNTTGILRANNISNDGTLNFEKIIYIDNKNIKNEQKIKENDILIAMSSGSKELVGKAAQATKDYKFAFGAFCGIVRPKNINSKFIGYFFQTNYYRNKISGLSTGININNLRKEYIENMDILIPNNPQEQEEIVRVLDLASDMVRLRKACIQHTTDLIPAIFQEMFGDPVNNTKNYPLNSLKNLCLKIGSGATPKGGKESYITSGIALVRSMNVYDGEFKYKDLAFITEEQAENLSNVELKENDVLFNITGASLARTCVLPKNILPARVNQHVSILRCGNLLSPYFFNVLLYFPSIKNQLLDLGNFNGATREAITKGQLETFKIIVPPLEQQELFAQKVMEIEKYKNEQLEELKKAEQMFQSLLHHAFTGELTSNFKGDN